MAKIAKKTKRYPSDLTDEEWEQIAPLMPKPGRRGRPREVDFREVINAVRYLVRSGCGWRMLPVHFGAWQTVYAWFRELARRFLFQTIHDVALMIDRERAGREASPSAAVIDSQSVKAPHAATRGYDAGKKIVGRKRHIAVDTDGRLLVVNPTTADISDSAGAQMILDSVRKRWPWLKHLFADSAYDRISGENLFVVLLVIGPSSQELGPRANPGWFITDDVLPLIPCKRGLGRSLGVSAEVRRVSTIRPERFSISAWPMKQSLASIPGPLR